MATVFRIFALASAIALSRNTVLGSLDGVCPLEGCDLGAAPGNVFIQKVKQKHPEQTTKVVAEEAAATLPLTQARPPALKSSRQNGAVAMLAEGAARANVKHSVAKGKFEALLKRLAAKAASKHSLAKPFRIPAKGQAFPSVEGALSMMQMSSKHVGMARLASKAAPRAHLQLRGWTAPLDEPGYQAIVGLKSDDDMEMFIRRVIDAYDCKITNQGGFMGVVPWFSGTTSTGSFVKLQETLLYAVLHSSSPWLSYKNTDGTTGSSAELSFMGYVEVAATRSDNEMVLFAKRICDKLGVKVVNEDGFHGMVRWYSGADNFQDYGRLEQEIVSAARAPHSWAAWKDPTAPHP